VVQGDPETVLGVAAAELQAHGLAGLVIGFAPSPCAWREPCASSLYLIRTSGGQAQWVESRSEETEEGVLVVSTRRLDLAPSVDQMTALGGLTLGGSLLGPLSHEVNNLVQGLSAAVYLLDDCIATGDAIDTELVTDMGDVVDELASVGRTLQHFLRQAGGDAEALDINEVIANAAAFLRSMGKLKTVAFSVERSAEVPRLVWPAAELDYLVLALLCNAAEAAANNSDTMEVRVLVLPSDSVLTLEFHDSGPGFSYEQSSLPFASSDQRRRHAGLGLSIVRMLVASHGGSIAVETSAKGSTVRVALPMSS
jgi:nitrogen-specific signal transduction histidine kinase